MTNTLEISYVVSRERELTFKSTSLVPKICATIIRSKHLDVDAIKHGVNFFFFSKILRKLQ